MSEKTEIKRLVSLVHEFLIENIEGEKVECSYFLNEICSMLELTPEQALEVLTPEYESALHEMEKEILPDNWLDSGGQCDSQPYKWLGNGSYYRREVVSPDSSDIVIERSFH